MAKTNKTEFALLGILNIEPMSGYDLKSFIQQSIGYFWQESYGQIYPALRRLATQKLVTKRKAKTSRGPERFVYSITAAGRKAFRRWLATEPEPETIRHELLLKLFFGTMGERDDHIRYLENLLAGQRQRLGMFDQIEKQLPQYQDQPNYPYWQSTLRYGLHLTRARVAWCEETLDWLKNGNRPKTKKRRIPSQEPVS